MRHTSYILQRELWKEHFRCKAIALDLESQVLNASVQSSRALSTRYDSNLTAKHALLIIIYEIA